MVKMMQLLVRADDYTHEEFLERWEGSHADLARDLPGLRAYVTNTPTDPERSAYDGVVELTFDSFDDLKAAFDSETGREVVADAEAFADMDAGETLYLDATDQLAE